MKIELLLCNYKKGTRGLKKGSILGELQEVCQTYLWVKLHNSYMHLMTNYEIYDTFYPSVHVLASYLTCLVAQLINSLLVYVCMLVMLIFYEWTSILCSVGYLLIMLCIFVFTCLWFSSCLAHECIPYLSPSLQPRKPKT